MSFSRYTDTSSTNWGYPLYLCECCPYGYHIDLDFVRYCESISKEADRTGSIKRRKDRRRQRKSMEVLLGLSALEELNCVKPKEAISPIIETENRALQKQDSFDNVIDDFEKTFQRSKKKLSSNLPDVTAVSDFRRTGQNPAESVPVLSGHIKMKKFPHGEYETTNDHRNLGPTAFKNIREQMALSLERTRQLEEENKQIPDLKVQLSTLKEENKRLIQELKLKKEIDINTINANFFEKTYNRRNLSGSLTVNDSRYERDFKKATSPSTKDIGVTCTVLTRNVGVGNQTPSRKNASTETSPDGNFADKWFGEKLKFISDKYEKERVKDAVVAVPTDNRSSQTPVKNTSSSTTQTVEVPTPKKIQIERQTQTLQFSQKNQAVTAQPQMVDFNVQKSIDAFNVGVSEDTVDDVNCEKCNIAKISVAVGADKNEDAHVAPISLASLSFPRSKSFNLGEDKINLSVRKRSIAVQYQYKAEHSSKSSQYEPMSTSRSCQSSIKMHSRGSQHEFKLVENSTQSESSSFEIRKISKKDVSCQSKESRPETVNIGCNTATATVCLKCQSRERDEDRRKDVGKSERATPKKERKREEPQGKDELLNVSRIPRLNTTPTLDRRVFRRQDTYTKTLASEEITGGLSGLDLTPKSTVSSEGPFKLPDSPKSAQTQSGSILKLPEETTFETCVSSTPYVSAAQSKHRKKAIPSKEMQGAMKVLNDSLQKQTKLPKNHRAIDIIQQEWFKISGITSANPLDVEDYLDLFEDMSSLLLDYIVNMTDASGNTAMHYAVSHGNFDVVSILLDSKVCDINKPNKAGYTSVMLVSLADIRSQTHANVVRRLFQMADVNIRAKQHGQTALMLAVSHGRLDMVKMLLEAGADINIQDDDGSTALMCAAEHGHIEIVKHFLSQPDCDSTITDVDGSTALKISMEAEHRSIGVLLYAHERNLMAVHGHKHKKKSSSPKPPSSPLPIPKCLDRR